MECAAAQVCREAGAQVSTNVHVRDLDLADLSAPPTNQRGFALPCKMNGEDSARALARTTKKVAVSSLQRPPTSAARTTNRARPLSPASSGYVRSFRAWQLPVQHRHSLQPPGASVAVQTGDQGGVDGQLCSMPQARQPRLLVGGRRQRDSLCTRSCGMHVLASLPVRLP